MTNSHRFFSFYQLAWQLMISGTMIYKSTKYNNWQTKFQNAGHGDFYLESLSDSLVIHGVIPGVSKEMLKIKEQRVDGKIHLTVESDKLSILGRELQVAFTFTAQIGVEQITAKLQNGILEIRMAYKKETVEAPAEKMVTIS